MPSNLWTSFPEEINRAPRLVCMSCKVCMCVEIPMIVQHSIVQKYFSANNLIKHYKELPHLYPLLIRPFNRHISSHAPIWLAIDDIIILRKGSRSENRVNARSKWEVSKFHEKKKLRETLLLWYAEIQKRYVRSCNQSIVYPFT